jgi:hypothetical protein
MSAHHAPPGPECPLCREKAAGGHPVLATWFWNIKAVFNDAHASCFFRNEQEQLIDFQQGRSKAVWPNSLHNTMLGGQPRARAFDLFQLRPDGVAYFGRDYFQKIAVWAARAEAPLLWGGGDSTPVMQKLGDFPHFQLKQSVV